jgi:hypothetical protein
MQFGNFFIDVDNYVEATSTAWVDILSEYDIDESETYFLVNGVQVSGTLTDIVGGKRLSYDPPDDFVSDGALLYTAHARNVNSEVIEYTYTLLFGYNLEAKERFTWKNNEVVSIRAEAINKALCPNKESIGYNFTTRDLRGVNLGATINCIQLVDLTASIYPQSTTFFYGKTYTIKVSGIKDYHNNEMEPFEFSFTIEQP